MADLKLRVQKANHVNPSTKQKGFVARVLTNGTADFDSIAKEAGHNTTMHRAELRMAFELCIDSVSEMLKQGYIVDLGPIGKLYPSCSSGWYEKAEDISLDDVKPSLYYKAGDDVAAAVKAAKLVWARSDDEEEDGTQTFESSQTPEGDSGGSGSGDSVSGSSGSGDSGGGSTGGNSGSDSDDDGDDVNAGFDIG